MSTTKGDIDMNYAYAILNDNDNQGYYVAAKVPMNNLPGCDLFFWQQVSKHYQTKAWAERARNKLLRKDAMK